MQFCLLFYILISSCMWDTLNFFIFLVIQVSCCPLDNIDLVVEGGDGVAVVGVVNAHFLDLAPKVALCCCKYVMITKNCLLI